MLHEILVNLSEVGEVFLLLEIGMRLALGLGKSLEVCILWSKNASGVAEKNETLAKVSQDGMDPNGGIMLFLAGNADQVDALMVVLKSMMPPSAACAEKMHDGLTCFQKPSLKLT